MSRPILTAAQMRAAEAAAIAAGTPVETLMERAGAAAAEAIWRHAGPMPALVLCGPGNNGGDGWVIARRLAERGVPVRAASAGEPGSGAAREARSRWTGPVEPVADAAAAPLLIDALFGTGLTRPLDPALAQRLGSLAGAARIKAAVDLPSGVASDDGAILSPVPPFDLTVTFASLKPSHLLQPAAARMGRIVVADIGIEAVSDLWEVGRPRIDAPGPTSHKYSRGYVAVIAGEMPGAAALAAAGALRGGAGYVRLIGAGGAAPEAVVRSPASDLPDILGDPRLGAMVVGPGLGRGQRSWDRLDAVMRSEKAVVLDGDAFALIAARGYGWTRRAATFATPHSGEFQSLFGPAPSKLEATRRAAADLGAILVHKGADTVIAAPDRRAAIHAASAHWLATAGTGDVLAGLVAARSAAGSDPFEAACAAVWLHGRAAELAGPGLAADDLPLHLPPALAECL